MRIRKEKKRIKNFHLGDSIFDKVRLLGNETLLTHSQIVTLLIQDTDQKKVKRLVNKYTYPIIQQRENLALRYSKKRKRK